MKLYTCNSFKGYWPVGSAAVVWAETEGKAEMVEFCPDESPRVRILCDGNY